MTLPIFLTLWAISEEVGMLTTTPIWVPIIILGLILLIFVWGLTRGNVPDENMPAADGHEVAEDLHGEDAH